MWYTTSYHLNIILFFCKEYQLLFVVIIFRRFRVEHAQEIRIQDRHRFADSAIIASMQPYHIIDDGMSHETVVFDCLSIIFKNIAILRSVGRKTVRTPANS